MPQLETQEQAAQEREGEIIALKAMLDEAKQAYDTLYAACELTVYLASSPLPVVRHELDTLRDHVLDAMATATLEGPWGITDSDAVLAEIALNDCRCCGAACEGVSHYCPNCIRSHKA